MYSENYDVFIGEILENPSGMIGVGYLITLGLKALMVIHAGAGFQTSFFPLLNANKMNLPRNE